MGREAGRAADELQDPVDRHRAGEARHPELLVGIALDQRSGVSPHVVHRMADLGAGDAAVEDRVTELRPQVRARLPSVVDVRELGGVPCGNVHRSTHRTGARRVRTLTRRPDGDRHRRGTRIGRAIAVALARAGADVAVASRTVPELEAAAEDIRALGRRALVVPTDMTDEEAVRALVRAAVDELGRLDVMVNNAGVAPFTATFMETRPTVSGSTSTRTSVRWYPAHGRPARYCSSRARDAC